MLRKLLLLAATSWAVLGVGVALAAGTFDGSPASPLPVTSGFTEPDGTVWDVQVHSRNSESWFTLPAIAAQHGADCAAPPATHLNTSYEGSVFQCRDHVMTAINGSAGYAAIYLTPNRILDFSGGGSVTFDLSLERASTRDWWDILITPFGDNLALPLLSNLSQGVDLQGAPRNTIHIGTDNGEGSPVLTVVRNGVEQAYGGSGLPANADVPPGVNQAATRVPFKLTIGGGRIKFERLAAGTIPGLTFVDVAASVPFTSGVVQFGHHSYTPEKDGAGVPGTWHWDNLNLTPSAPFTMIKADRRYTEGGVVNFDAPAPEGSYLRFSAICRVTINGTLVARAADYDRWGVGYHPEHMSSYFVPVAAGTQSVTFGFANDGWYTTGFGCLAKDFSIWNQAQGQSVPTATPNPPTATPTAVDPTATPTAMPTNTPTLTPAATATSTPTPAVYRCQRRNPNGTWTTVWSKAGGGSCP